MKELTLKYFIAPFRTNISVSFFSILFIIAYVQDLYHLIGQEEYHSSRIVLLVKANATEY